MPTDSGAGESPVIETKDGPVVIIPQLPEWPQGPTVLPVLDNDEEEEGDD